MRVGGQEQAPYEVLMSVVEDIRLNVCEVITQARARARPPAPPVLSRSAPPPCKNGFYLHGRHGISMSDTTGANLTHPQTAISPSGMAKAEMSKG